MPNTNWRHGLVRRYLNANEAQVMRMLRELSTRRAVTPTYANHLLRYGPPNELQDDGPATNPTFATP